ncbi:MAG: hypothetical protein ABIQ82_06140 [Variovorax sp.]
MHYIALVDRANIDERRFDSLMERLLSEGATFMRVDLRAALERSG